MEMVLAGLSGKTYLAYIDDVIVYSKNFDDHVSDLRDVLERLGEAGLTLKPKKYVFGGKKRRSDRPPENRSHTDLDAAPICDGTPKFPGTMCVLPKICGWLRHPSPLYRREKGALLLGR